MRSQEGKYAVILRWPISSFALLSPRIVFDPVQGPASRASLPISAKYKNCKKISQTPSCEIAIGLFSRAAIQFWEAHIRR
jgi:hypothetical protein